MVTPSYGIREFLLKKGTYDMEIESGAAPFVKSPLWWVPIVSTSIGAFALCFQVFVLYPWHLQLSSEFASLSQACLK